MLSVVVIARVVITRQDFSPLPLRLPAQALSVINLEKLLATFSKCWLTSGKRRLGNAAVGGVGDGGAWRGRSRRRGVLGLFPRGAGGPRESLLLRQLGVNPSMGKINSCT